MLAQFEAERLAKLPWHDPPRHGASQGLGVHRRRRPRHVPGKGLGPPAWKPHTLHITLFAHDAADVTATLKGNTTLDLGTVVLQPSFGSLSVSSSPDGLDFSVRPAGDPASRPVHSGRTPAAYDDLVHGDYVVTFARPGCHDHNEKATIQKGSKTSVATTYTDGALELSSDPSGASVAKDGAFLGTTPLTLHDLTPKMTPFILTLPGYDATPITCDIPEGQTLTYSAQLLRRDRIFNAGEVKTHAREDVGPRLRSSAPASASWGARSSSRSS